MLSLLKLITNKNDFFIRTFLFLSYSFGIGRINTLIQTPSSLENDTRFQTKMGKVCVHFRTKQCKHHTSWGGTYLMAYREGVHTGKRHRQLGNSDRL